MYFVIIESFGEFVMRQGHGNLVERNISLGGHVEGTGGVRLTSNDHIIRGNYFEGLGSKVGSSQSAKLGNIDNQSAIRLMNGVPNSPDQKHFQVTNAIINPQGSVPFAVKSDDSGITSSENVIVYSDKVKNNNTPPVGFSITEGIVNTTDDGLRYLNAKSWDSAGAAKNLKPVKSSKVGVAWYN